MASLLFLLFFVLQPDAQVDASEVSNTLLEHNVAAFAEVSGSFSAGLQSFSENSASGAALMPSTSVKASFLHSEVSLQSLAISSSVLAALLESPFTDFMELVERAALLQPLERVVDKKNITIFAPRNAFLEQHLDSEFRRFLLEPGNAKSLRRVLQYHVLLGRIMAADWANSSIETLSSDRVHIYGKDGKLKVEHFTVGAPDMIVSRDGVVHGINGLLMPKAVQNLYLLQRKGDIPAAVLPQAAPEVDLRGNLEDKYLRVDLTEDSVNISEEVDSLADIAPAPGPSAAHYHAYGWQEVTYFVSSLVDYGGYSEMADLLVNLTSFAWDLAKLVNEGYKLTVLAPNDQAIARLTAEQLAASGAIEEMLMYHVLSEYQTEESLYNAVRRSGKAIYSTLSLPHKLTAVEAEGTVQFGTGKGAATVYDPDIFADGHVSVQGINAVLFPLSSEGLSQERGLSGSASASTSCREQHISDGVDC
ncbi:hypothetical protein O6H91_17G034000 [Diphasiastrum complanatum]|uniref:Uncharacterized protein n=1 Tax=Diphasiastrum complanatum TaxID=34168 RepID=A0ACC2B5M5_DIPCM|nr:hypothetical protein O6H91_17G034000 [Diphasiastrum complanatum]